MLRENGDGSGGEEILLATRNLTLQEILSKLASIKVKVTIIEAKVEALTSLPPRQRGGVLFNSWMKKVCANLRRESQ